MFDFIAIYNSLSVYSLSHTVAVFYFSAKSKGWRERIVTSQHVEIIKYLFSNAI